VSLPLANIFDQKVMRKILTKMLMSTDSSEAPVIFLWEIAHVISVVL
jgi:hypothetical protein